MEGDEGPSGEIGSLVGVTSVCLRPIPLTGPVSALDWQ
jgi:hypothetical protein